jgi:hypothetical protein
MQAKIKKKSLFFADSSKKVLLPIVKTDFCAIF